jgi:hypothetical protein
MRHALLVGSSRPQNAAHHNVTFHYIALQFMVFRGVKRKTCKEFCTVGCHIHQKQSDRTIHDLPHPVFSPALRSTLLYKSIHVHFSCGVFPPYSEPSSSMSRYQDARTHLRARTHSHTHTHTHTHARARAHARPSALLYMCMEHVTACATTTTRTCLHGLEVQMSPSLAHPLPPSPRSPPLSLSLSLSLSSSLPPLFLSHPLKVSRLMTARMP